MEPTEALIRRLIREILNDPDRVVEVTLEGEADPGGGAERYVIDIPNHPVEGRATAFAINPSTVNVPDDVLKAALAGALTRAQDDLGLSFGDALVALKDGHRITRPGWNGRGMWLCYMESVTIAAGLVNERTRRFVPEGDLNVGGYIVMFTAQGVWQPGWLASQADLLAEDWIVLPD